jgi:DNA replication and repair protein RecF
VILSRLRVSQFRNLLDVDLEFDPGITIIQGANAQGKTNLLEAIGMLVTGRSFRTRDERDLLPWSASPDTGIVVRGSVISGQQRDLLCVGLVGRRKHVTLNGETLRRLSDLLGHLRAVLFVPDDLELISGPPALRRRLLDMLLIQSNPAHLDDLQRYDNAMRHRNALLRKLGREGSCARSELLDTYEQHMAQYGPPVTHRRRALLESLRPLLTDYYSSLRASGSEELDAEFSDGCGDADQSPEKLMSAYYLARESDRVRGQAGMGCHRDDFRYLLNRRKAAQFASQGQRRTAAIATKLAEVACLHRLSGTPPLLLMDDLLSELDSGRQAALLSGLPSGTQTFITTTDAHEKLPVEGRILTCKNGNFFEASSR